MNHPLLLWFRQDLRLHDHPALQRALSLGRPIIPLYIHDPKAGGAWANGRASNWWLHHSLRALQTDIAEKGGQLILRTGDAAQILTEFYEKHGVREVFVSRRYEPWARRQDRQLFEWAEDHDVAFRQFSGSLLFEPEDIQTKGGSPYKVFTPFYKFLRPKLAGLLPPGEETPLTFYKGLLETDALEHWDLLPSKPNWAKNWGEYWTPGERAARSQFLTYLEDAVSGYPNDRDFPALNGTSRLSASLHFGELSPRGILHQIQLRMAALGSSEGAEAWLRQLVWREFANHLLFHFPETPQQNLNNKFDPMPWGKKDDPNVKKWTYGRTGYPIVDAAMRQLQQTGWMHNRLRMIAASYLIKHLMVDWRVGQDIFWDTLVDADLANNAMGWQWVAGCGVDAAPYFRIFNPTLQSEKFDKSGHFIRQFCPELANLPDRYIHQPSKAPSLVLKAAGVKIGQTYPDPIIDHSFARDRALQAYKGLKEGEI